MQKCIFFDFSCQNIWPCKKFVVPLHAFSACERQDYALTRIIIAEHDSEKQWNILVKINKLTKQQNAYNSTIS